MDLKELREEAEQSRLSHEDHWEKTRYVHFDDVLDLIDRVEAVVKEMREGDFQDGVWWPAPDSESLAIGASDKARQWADRLEGK